MKNLVEGLLILMKYCPDGDVSAGDSCIYATPNIKEGDLSEDDVHKLYELDGWHWSDEANSWACFV